MAQRLQKSTIRERAAALTAAEVRYAARQHKQEGGIPPAGLGKSRKYNVWIDLGKGKGPEPYPPKVILVWATGGELPEREGYARNGVWLPRLEALGFPVLEKGEKPGRERSCRGVDIDAAHARKAADASTLALTLPPTRPKLAAVTLAHVEEAAAHLLAHDRTFSNFAESKQFDVWVDGEPFPVRMLSACAWYMAGAVPAPTTEDFNGTQDRRWHDRLLDLGLRVRPSSYRMIVGTRRQSRLPRPDDLTRDAIVAAGSLWHEQCAAFRERHAAQKHQIWIDGNAYPVKAICMLAWEWLGFVGPEQWKKGGLDSHWNRQLDEELGYEILPVGRTPEPDSDDGRSRAEAEDVRDIKRRVKDATTRKRLVDARIGQGDFRRNLEAHWGKACAVTGVSLRQVLRASHIKPWRTSDDTERLDPHNGLLLVSNLDCLFDRGLISFAKDGTLLVGKVSDEEQRKLGLLGELKLRADAPSALTEKRLAFLMTHRKKYGFPAD